MREVTSDTGWPTYNGDTGGNRHTTLAQIDKTNVARLAPSWMFTLPNAAGLQGTPVVADGLMYVTAPNEIFALDAGSGRQVWHFKRARTQGVAQGWANRGASVAGDRVFLATDNAHVIALNRWTGALLWDTQLADWRQNYSGSSAPLPAGNLVIAGVAGGEHGANGFVAAHDQETGKEIWRFWAVPRPGEPGSETWKGTGPADHRGAPTWFTGSYDPALDLVYWPVGNPSQEYNGDDRDGDNLYANSLLALDRKTGRLKWHYQFTPHDLWDWDATQTSVVVDAEWQGRPRQLLLHASRNGFFYVFDRAVGTLLLGKPFVRNLTWASGIGADGRPIKVAGTGAERGGHQGVPVAGRRDQLVLAVVQPGHRALLRADVREVQHLYEDRRRRVGSGQAVSRRLAADRAGSGSAARAQGHRHPHRRDQVGAAAAGAGQLLGRHAVHRDGPGHLRRRRGRADGGRCRHRHSRCGASRPITTGRRRR